MDDTPRLKRATRHVFALMLTFAGAATARALPQSPFMPVPEAADHVVTMKVLRDWGGGGGGDTWTIARRGDWYGVSSRYAREPYVRYVKPSGSLSVQLSRSASGSFTQLQLRRGPQEQYDSYWKQDRVKTGDTRLVLGELCEVWQIAHLGSASVRLDADYSCITSDGIELAFKRLDRTGSEDFSAEAVSVERRPVLPVEAQPPPNMLDLAMWLDRSELSEAAGSTKADAGDDYEAVLRLPDAPPTWIRGHSIGPGSSIRVRRRKGDWAYVDTDSVGWRRELRVENHRAKFQFSFRQWSVPVGIGSWETVELLAMEKLSRMQRSGILGSGGGTESGLSETIVGETCQWFEISRHIHGGRDECRTADGIVLRERAAWNGGDEEYEVIRLRRGRIALGDVLPPRSLLRPVKWRLPR